MTFITVKSRQAGFTLIEIMAVMLIIGIAVGMATVSIGDGTDGHKLRTAMRQLYQSIQLAAEETVYKREQYGLRFDIDNNAETERYSYEWMIYDPKRKRWFAVEVPELAKQVLPEGLMLELTVDEQTVTIGQTVDDDEAIFEVKKDKKDRTKIYPDLYFFSSGEMQNFTIRLYKTDETDPDSAYVISGNMLGQVEFIAPGEEDSE